MTAIKELMISHPRLIDPGSTLRDAAKRMQDSDCRSLVAGRDGRPEGMITDRDIVIWGLAQDHDPDNTAVGDVMTYGVITCYEDQTVEQAVEEMADTDVRRLVVLDRKDRVVGVLSAADILKCAGRAAVDNDVVHQLFRQAS